VPLAGAGSPRYIGSGFSLEWRPDRSAAARLNPSRGQREQKGA